MHISNIHSSNKIKQNKKRKEKGKEKGLKGKERINDIANYDLRKAFLT